MSPVIRTAESPKDLLLLRKVIQEEAGAHEPVMFLNIRQELIASGFYSPAIPDDRNYVVEEGGAIVGGAVTSFMSQGEAQSRILLGEDLAHHDYTVLNLNWVATASSHRGLGVGRSLVERIVTDARSLGVRQLVGVSEGSTSLDDFYRKCGFTVTERNVSPENEELERRLEQSTGVGSIRARPEARYFYMDL